MCWFLSGACFMQPCEQHCYIQWLCEYLVMFPVKQEHTTILRYALIKGDVPADSLASFINAQIYPAFRFHPIWQFCDFTLSILGAKEFQRPKVLDSFCSVFQLERCWVVVQWMARSSCDQGYNQDQIENEEIFTNANLHVLNNLSYVQGICRPEDAVKAVEAGFTTIWVSLC